MAKTTYYNVDESAIYDLAKEVVSLYKIKDITTYINDGKPIPPKYSKLIERPISSIYSNINGYISLQTLLSNTIKYPL